MFLLFRDSITENEGGRRREGALWWWGCGGDGVDEEVSVIVGVLVVVEVPGLAHDPQQKGGS